LTDRLTASYHFISVAESAPEGVEARALCVVKSPKLKRTLERALRAAGYDLECCESLTDATSKAAILFVDHETRQATDVPELVRSVGAQGSVVILGDSLESNDVANLLREQHLDHLISDSQNPDEAEILVTTVKLVSGDIFGLEKYLPWGAKVHEVRVSNYDEKRAALKAVVEHAESVGARRALIARLEHVTDELLMNALYDAPAVHSGVSTMARISSLTQSGSASFGGESAVLRFGCDGRYFAVSASDPYGELKKEVIFDHLIRARRERGAPNQEGGPGGAGLGLYFILSSVTRFIANIEPGNRTEVVCLFDLRQSGRGRAAARWMPAPSRCTSSSRTKPKIPRPSRRPY